MKDRLNEQEDKPVMHNVNRDKEQFLYFPLRFPRNFAPAYRTKSDDSITLLQTDYREGNIQGNGVGWGQAQGPKQDRTQGRIRMTFFANRIRDTGVSHAGTHTVQNNRSFL